MKNKTLGQKIFWLIAGLMTTWLLFTFMIFPILNLFNITLFPNGEFDLQPVFNILNSERVRKALFNSFLLGILVAITTNILGIFQVLALDYFDIKGRKILNVLCYLPLVINGMVLVLAYNFNIGTQGIITNWLQGYFPGLPDDWFLGLPAVLLQFSFSNTMYHVTFVRDSLQNLDYQTVEAARNMGASTGSILRKVVLPTLLPSILAATILNFNSAISAFASTKVLGGEKFETINPMIYTFAQSNTTKNYAVVLSVFLGLSTLIVLLIFNYIESRRNIISVSKTKTKIQRQKISNPFLNALVTFAAYLISFIQLFPALTVVVLSFMTYENLLEGNINPANFTLDNYRLALTSAQGMQPVVVSTIYAVSGAILSIVIILIFARWITKYNNRLTNLLESVLMIPWFLPATLLALSFLFTFNQPTAPVAGRVLTGTFIILLIAYIVFRLPSNLRIIKSAYLSVDGALEDAAKNLGANSMKTYLKVIFPILLPTVMSTALLSFNSLFAEFNMSVFLFHPLYMPLGVVINNATNAEADPANVMLSFVYAVIIMIASITAIYLVYGRRERSK